MKRTKKIAQYGLTVALALVLSYVEAQVPPFFAIPGVKLGLTNVVVLYALYVMGVKSALLINIIRILLVGAMFGNGVSLMYSLAGGILSWIAMVVLKECFKFHIVAVSVAGGVFHNIGQILVAMVLLQTKAIAWYFLILWFTGIAAGVLIGVICGNIVKRATVSTVR